MLQCQAVQYITNTVTDFKELLNRIADRFDSRDALAKALGMNGSRLSRALNSGDFPFNVANCLRLAKISGEPPSKVLRAAGKADVAELLESLYKPSVNEGERELLDLWDTLSKQEQHGVMSLLRSVHHDRQGAARKRRSA